MKAKYTRTGTSKDAPYEVSVDGTVVGTIKKKRDSYTGIQRGGTYTSWVATTPGDQWVQRTGLYFDNNFETTDDFNQRTKFSTRAEAAQALIALAGVEAEA